MCVIHTKNSYRLHPQKSTVAHHLRSRSNTYHQKHNWKLGDETMNQTDKYTHLGLEWPVNRMAPDINKNITTARKTAYKLMGAGFHGINGLDPAASVKLVETYVVPQLLHGTEATVLTQKEISALNQYHKRLLKQIQGLPDSTANEAVYLLSGTQPLEATLHSRIMSLFGMITQLSPDHMAHQLARRQLATKHDKSRSWFVYAQHIASIYDINLHKLLQHPWPKRTWKQYTSCLITGHWSDKLEQSALQKSSLKWMIPNHSQAKKPIPHPMWSACKGKQHLVEASNVRAKLLVGRLPLQSNLARYSKGDVSPWCLLCQTEEEDTEHFLIRCEKISAGRGDKITALLRMYSDHGLPPPSSDSEVCSAILNGGCYKADGTSDNSNSNVIYLNSKSCTKAHQIATILCYKLFQLRDIMINNMHMLTCHTSTEGSPE